MAVSAEGPPVLLPVWQAAISMAISTARNVLAGSDGKLDPSMVLNREVL
jgi:hypothetical protein